MTNWIDINKHKPTKKDLGKVFLVAIPLSTRYEYQVAEWYDPKDGEREPFFLIEHSWIGLSMIAKEVTHWMEIEKLKLVVEFID